MKRGRMLNIILVIVNVVSLSFLGYECLRVPSFVRIFRDMRVELSPMIKVILGVLGHPAFLLSLVLLAVFLVIKELTPLRRIATVVNVGVLLSSLLLHYCFRLATVEPLTKIIQDLSKPG